MTAEELISCALDIGEQMLLSGAEVGRVETSVKLICTAYGCSRTDVFTITSSIVVSIVSADGVHITQTRRIMGGSTNLTRLDRLNSLSRELCRTTPDYAYAQEKLQAICAQKAFPLWVEALASALIAGAFAKSRDEPDLCQCGILLPAFLQRNQSGAAGAGTGYQHDHHWQYHAADSRHCLDQLPAGYDQRRYYVRHAAVF